MEYEVKQLLKPALYSDIINISENDFSKFKNKTVLITGAGELLGFYLACAFLVNNDINSTETKIIAVDKSDNIFKQYGKLTYRNDIEFVVSDNYSNLSNVSADLVIHTNKPENDIETTGILEFIKSNNASAVVCSYSDVYGDVYNGKDTISEYDMGYCDCYNPEYKSIQMQRNLESAAIALAKKNDLDIKIARVCRVFGYHGFSENDRFAKVFSDVVNKHNIVINKDDNLLVESYIYVTDAATALIKILCGGKKAKIYNVSSDFAASVHVLAKYCVKIFSDSAIKIVYKDKLKTLSPMSVTLKILENTKLKSIGFEPKVDLQDGIVQSVKILLEEKNK
ncbi:MAG: NAD(P)-dependent oxidoreductase [Ruminococcus sp.]|nr:NAD(P)-dependent oxidoreductase [Ruminococcus sp.]